MCTRGHKVLLKNQNGFDTVSPADGREIRSFGDTAPALKRAEAISMPISIDRQPL